MRNGSTLSSGPDYNIVITTNSSTNVSMLTVLSSTPLDAGDYSCFVANGVKNVTASATLTIYIVPNVSVAMSAYAVDENSTVTFQCTGTGVPEPFITWYINGVLINNGRFINLTTSVLDSSTLIYNVTGSMTITNVYYTDAFAEYSCIATNTAGYDVDSFDLAVYCK